MAVEHHFVVVGTVINGQPRFELADEKLTDNLFPDGMLYDTDDNEWVIVEDIDSEVSDNDETLYNRLLDLLS